MLAGPIMDPTKYNFETLQALSVGRAVNTTFAYWLGVLSDPTAEIAQNADDALSAMSFQFDIEEQAHDLSGLCGFRDGVIPTIFHPIAPVTLALRWSPFPAAFSALGEPVALNRGRFAKTLAVFKPVESPLFPAKSADERHFLFLLRRTCERAFRSKRWVLLAGSPGWSYTDKDFITEKPDLQKLMAAFGFVFYARKPADT